MALHDFYAAGFKEALEKLSVSGSLYANALQGAAARGGGRVAPQNLLTMASQPRATRSPFLSEQARAPGAMAPTTGQAAAQGVMNQMPWAGSEHGGGPGAAQQYDKLLQGAGRVHEQPNVSQQIRSSFGPSSGPGAAFDPTHSMGNATVAAKPQRPSPLSPQ